MPLVGDFTALNRFASNVRELEELPRLVALGSVAKLEAVVLKEFDAGEDPYGNPWAPLKAGGPPLQPLSGDVEVTAFGAGKIRAEALYPANFHHTGTRNVSKKRAAKELRKDLALGKRLALRSGTYSAKAHEAERATIAERAAAISAAQGMHDPKRPIVPSDALGLPKTWEAVLEETAQELFEKAVA